MAIVKFRHGREDMATHWHYFFFSSERDRQVCYTIDTRRSNYANIFSYHFPSFYYIRTWQENPQKEILATPKYESKEEEQSGRTKQFKFWPSHVRWRFKRQAFKWNIILCLNVPLMLSFLLFPSCAWFFCFLFLTTLQFLTGILCRTTIAKYWY